MFLIPRRAGESVVLDDQIVVTILEVRGDKVRISIEAPPDIPIERGETMELKLSPQTGLIDGPRRATEPSGVRSCRLGESKRNTPALSGQVLVPLRFT